VAAGLYLSTPKIRTLFRASKIEALAQDLAREDGAGHAGDDESGPHSVRRNWRSRHRRYPEECDDRGEDADPRGT
jgi:hypothetical protein